MENYSLLMGAAAMMKMAVEMAAVSMEKPSGGTSPSGRVPEQRLLSPRSWLRDGGGSGRTMLFGVKNAGATYQRMMQKCLATQIGKNIQVYIDNIVITTKKVSSMIDDLKETFDNLDMFHLKLNPTKCSFGVPMGELLGYLVSTPGFLSPDACHAIHRNPRNIVVARHNS
ncbi:hypothetical protein QYE76_022964 [Lolium multiflorum]|uniref:Reverse transcriptase domain-containing protein n=1 Tax=Lolium multiflorum TaxID=4521 RepID=A0AAD8VRT9_LOLMU|nr:hypothetical protein QYE76_022964 [Lolium multiflorum]